MFVAATLSGAAVMSLMAPASAVFKVGDQAYLFKALGSGRFMPTAIEIGIEADGWIPLLGGVEAGTEIVSGGVAELKSHWQYQGGE
jgi:hypothetical protein